MAGAFGGILAGVITEFSGLIFVDRAHRPSTDLLCFIVDGVGNTPGWQWSVLIHTTMTTALMFLIQAFRDRRYHDDHSGWHRGLCVAR